MLFLFLSILTYLALRVSAQTPPGFTPGSPVGLNVVYQEKNTVDAGDRVLPSTAATKPVITYLGGQGDKQQYIIFLIDLDVPSGQESTTLLHWYQPDISIPHNGTLSYEESLSRTAMYVGPQPPPGPWHRYVFLLFRQPRDYKLPKSYESMLPLTIPARIGFNITHFMEVAELQSPIAASFFLSAQPADEVPAEYQEL